MKTTELVDSGIYAVVMHPQFLASVLLRLSMVLISQHWLNAALFFPNAPNDHKITSLR